eukprot:5183880-Pleurochrysis_carterae.AAC.1
MKARARLHSPLPSFTFAFIHLCLHSPLPSFSYTLLACACAALRPPACVRVRATRWQRISSA